MAWAGEQIAGQNEKRNLLPGSDVLQFLCTVTHVLRRYSLGGKFTGFATGPVPIPSPIQGPFALVIDICITSNVKARPEIRPVVAGIEDCI